MALLENVKQNDVVWYEVNYYSYIIDTCGNTHTTFVLFKYFLVSTSS